MADLDIPTSCSSPPLFTTGMRSFPAKVIVKQV